jgi:TatD DNase family protein
MFIDSHCHLEGPQYDADRAAVLQRARGAAVEAIVAIGNGRGPDDMGCGIEVGEEFDPSFSGNHLSARIFATVGIHPHEARLATDEHYERMRALARNPRVIAIGEIGLDYFYDHSPRDVQRRVFLNQIEVAREMKLPIVIHCRPSAADPEDAWQDCLDMIRKRWAASGLGGVMHCFTGTIEHARAALDMGFMVSFAGNVTFAKAMSIHEAARELPLDRILVETDSPYLAPVPNRGKRNEPAFVVDVAKRIAELRAISGEDIAGATTRNFYSFFNLHPCP